MEVYYSIIIFAKKCKSVYNGDDDFLGGECSE